MLDTSRVVG